MSWLCFWMKIYLLRVLFLGLGVATTGWRLLCQSFVSDNFLNTTSILHIPHYTRYKIQNEKERVMILDRPLKVLGTDLEDLLCFYFDSCENATIASTTGIPAEALRIDYSGYLKRQSDAEPKSFTNYYSATTKATQSYPEKLRLESSQLTQRTRRPKKKKPFRCRSAGTAYPPTTGKSYCFRTTQLVEGISDSAFGQADTERSATAGIQGHMQDWFISVPFGLLGAQKLFLRVSFVF